MGARTLAPLPASALLVAAIATAVVAPSCSDPVHDQEVAALGPENPAIPKGQYHRAGQPCGVCHGPEGPAQSTFTLAGTIFWNPLEGNGSTGAVGANNATVSVVDSLGVPTLISTNCVGNFWVTAAAYNPSFPLLVAVYTPEGTGAQPQMFTQISRTSSCATCHADPANYNAVGHVYLSSNPIPAADQNVTCPVDPNLEDQAP
jgi:hypothetical protein